jgi:hypothetical protein
MMGGDILAGDVDGERMGILAQETLRMHDYLLDHLERAEADSADSLDSTLMSVLARAVANNGIDQETHRRWPT